METRTLCIWHGEDTGGRVNISNRYDTDYEGAYLERYEPLTAAAKTNSYGWTEQRIGLILDATKAQAVVFRQAVVSRDDDRPTDIVIGRAGGEALAVAFRRTTGPAAKIGLSADTVTIKGDGEDLAFVTVDILDASGETVPTATDRVLLRIEGPGELAGLCNGDPTSLDTFGQNPVRAFSGRAVAVIRSRTGKTGVVKVRAEACDLDGAEIALTVTRQRAGLTTARVRSAS